jgi:hypothetical protein
MTPLADEKELLETRAEAQASQATITRATIARNNIRLKPDVFPRRFISCIEHVDSVVNLCLDSSARLHWFGAGGVFVII